MSKRTGNRRGRPPIHGCFSLLHKLDKEVSSPEIRAYLTSVRAGIIEDKGGSENMSTSELVMLDRILSKLGVLRLVELYCNRNGIMTGPALNPVLGDHYLAYANSIRLDLQALGLKRQSKEMDLQTYIKQNYPEPEKELSLDDYQCRHSPDEPAPPAKSTTDSQEAQGGDFGSDLDQQDGSK